ncbi:hypothetical protein E4634_18745 [Mangrovimicrobium sediminis]|uniref:Transporter n=1 Tax=Mangrovimicrobium sediminis TaxID=2562682 RepID=A0A4Z0LVJ6_9GAMM|nr:hypothetical protein [Haliea sp. SAOS-164]TGD71311.1 hypothetical protein E4634_18745 [Haliea sp. SAOS-164]
MQHAKRNTRTILRCTYSTALALACSFGMSDLTQAEEEPREKTAAEIAAELANPNTVLGTMNFNLDYIAFDGDLPDANDQSALRMTFQPSLPYPLESGMNFFARPAIPIILKQDVPVAGGYDERDWELGDIGFDVGVGKTFSNGVVAIGGMVGTLPTATDDAFGKDQWALGPEALIAIVKPWGALGLLVTHQWDVAGDNDVDTNVTAGQYFWVVNLKEGWQLRSGPTFAYDHEAESGQRWTFPVGVGINKTAILGKTPWKFGLEYWKYVEAPDTFGPDYQIRFVVAPVVPLPW